MYSEPYADLVNLTSHTIVIECNGRVHTIKPSGNICRIRGYQVPVGFIREIPVFRSHVDKITGIPPVYDGVIYITSFLVAQTLRRPDIVSPNSHPSSVIKDKAGNVVAVRSLQSFV